MRVINRKFNRDFQEIERYEAGISLLGAEVKSVKQGKIKLDNAFVKFLNDGPYLINAEIPIYQYSQPQGYDPKRSRKILLHKKEIVRLANKMKSGAGLTIVPVSCYNKKGLIKLEIALVKGRKEIEKKRLEKRKTIEKEREKELKEFLKKI